MERHLIFIDKIFNVKMSTDSMHSLPNPNIIIKEIEKKTTIQF